MQKQNIEIHLKIFCFILRTSAVVTAVCLKKQPRYMIQARNNIEELFNIQHDLCEKNHQILI